VISWARIADGPTHRSMRARLRIRLSIWRENPAACRGTWTRCGQDSGSSDSGSAWGDRFCQLLYARRSPGGAFTQRLCDDGLSASGFQRYSSKIDRFPEFSSRRWIPHRASPKVRRPGLRKAQTAGHWSASQG